MERYGSTAFVLLVTDSQYAEVKRLATQYKDILDIVGKPYEALEYTYLQLEVLDGSRELKEIADFILRIFPFVVMHQEDSTYIIAKDVGEFRKALNTLYTRENRAEFVYNMLTINERYDALEEACTIPITGFESVHIQKWIGGYMYSLLYDKGRDIIFSDDPEIYLLFDDRGEEEDVDICEGLGIFKFKVAILRKKS